MGHDHFERAQKLHPIIQTGNSMAEQDGAKTKKKQ